MGFVPAEVRGMTFWELSHMHAAWVKANAPDSRVTDEASAEAIAEMTALLARASNTLQ